MTPLTGTAGLARANRAAATGLWLFAASIVMSYASLYSGYVLLRTGSSTWETPWTSGGLLTFEPWLRTAWLGLAAGLARRAAGVAVATTWPGTVAGALFAMQSAVVASQLAAAGFTPARSVALACWFVLTGATAVLAAGGALAGLWIQVEAAPEDARARRRTLIARYWLLVGGLWLVTLAGLYLV